MCFWRCTEIVSVVLRSLSSRLRVSVVAAAVSSLPLTAPPNHRTHYQNSSPIVSLMIPPCVAARSVPCTRLQADRVADPSAAIRSVRQFGVPGTRYGYG